MLGNIKLENMIDPGTGLTILGSAIGSAKILEKILGPSAEYLGEQIKEWTKKKTENTSKIFQNAEKKLGDKINEKGRVAPKVLKGIIEEGAWCEEELQVEYFGGVLASSRTGVTRDDRGAYFISLISRLTTYQLRTHFIFYHSVKTHFNGQTLNIGDSSDRSKMEMFFPISSYVIGMDFTKEEYEHIWDLMTHSVWGLNKENLIDNFLYGDSDYLKIRYPEVKESGIIFQPTKLGIELFLWAYGLGQKSANLFFNASTEFKVETDLTIGEAHKTKSNNVA